MSVGRCLRPALVGLVLVTAAGPSAQGATDAETRASNFIDALSANAIEALTVAEVPRTERIARFRTLFNDHFAVEAIGKWILGRHWRQATVDEREKYLALFEDLIVVSYVDRFAEYTGEHLNVTRTVVVDSTNVTVYSEIMRPTGGPPVRVDWRVGSLDQTLKIVDVVVEGTSMSATLRSDFGSIIRRNGGGVAGLIAEMREKTQSLRK